jgi:hypothetical protein
MKQEEALKRLVNEDAFWTLDNVLASEKQDHPSTWKSLYRVTKVALQCRPRTLLRLGDAVQLIESDDHIHPNLGIVVHVNDSGLRGPEYRVFWLAESMRVRVTPQGQWWPWGCFRYRESELRLARLNKKKRNALLRWLRERVQSPQMLLPVPEVDEITYGSAKRWLLEQPTPLSILHERLSHIDGVRVEHDKHKDILHVYARFTMLSFVKSKISENG